MCVGGRNTILDNVNRNIISKSYKVIISLYSTWSDSFLGNENRRHTEAFADFLED